MLISCLLLAILISWKTTKLYNDLRLPLEGTEIPVVDQYKYLGIVFDKKLIDSTFQTFKSKM